MSPVILLAVRFANAAPTLALLPGLPGLPSFDAAAVRVWDGVFVEVFFAIMGKSSVVQSNC
jgi:hypothetical protein